jgi:hypothetical protein
LTEIGEEGITKYSVGLWGNMNMVLASRLVSPDTSVTPRTGFKKIEFFTLYYKDKTNFKFEAKSVEAAIRMAKRKLGLPPTASSERFRAAGGDYILQNSTGNRVYPVTQH